MIQTKLIAAAILLLAGLGGWWYVSHLQSKVVDLEAEVVQHKTKVVELTTQLQAVTTARDEMAQKAESAAATSTRVERELKTARARVKYVEVPASCPDAVDWLLKEISQ